jgi:hypothetical protein
MNNMNPTAQGHGGTTRLRRNRPMAANLGRRIEYSPAVQAWLDFLAGLLAQAARAERPTTGDAEITEGS